MSLPCRVRLEFALAIAAALLLSLPAVGETPTADGDRLRLSRVSVMPDGSVRAQVSVTDGRGYPLNDLGPANFSVTLDGREVNGFTLTPARDQSEGLSIVLALDVSRSMRGQKLQAARESAIEFIRSLRPEDQCCVLTFGSRVGWLVPQFTNNHQELESQLAELQANENGTVLYQALAAATKKAVSAPTSRVVTVAVTDGVDQDTAGGTLPQMLTELRLRDVPVYTIAVGARADARGLAAIAHATGGRFTRVTQPTRLASLYQRLQQQLFSQYTLAIPREAAVAGPFVLGVGAHILGSDLGPVEIEGGTQLTTPDKRAPTPTEVSTEPARRDSQSQLMLFVLGGLGVLGGAMLLVVRLLVRQRTRSAAARYCRRCTAPLTPAEGDWCRQCTTEVGTIPAEEAGAESRHAAPAATPAPAMAGSGPAGSAPASSEAPGRAREGAAFPGTPPTAPVPMANAPASHGTLVWLEVLPLPGEEGSGWTFDLPQSSAPLAIGRGSDCQIRVQGDRAVSRHQAAIAFDPTRDFFVLRDTEPADGNYVNGRRIKSPEVLREGDEIGLNNPRPRLVFHDRR